jgi:hypothetical protein
MGLIGLLDPGFARKIRESEEAAEKRRYEWMIKEGMITAFDEDKTPLEKFQLIDAATWKPVPLFDSPLVRGSPYDRLMRKKDRVECPGGRWFYLNHIIPKGTWLRTWQGKKRGEVAFTDDVVSPCLYEEQKHNKPITWMGYTPCEIYSQRAGIRLAAGRVVIGGLGLGWFLNKVALKKSVTEVILVDREQVLLDWLGPRIREVYPAVAAKTTWVCSDVYEFMEQDKENHERTKYLLDIWPTFGHTDRSFDEWKKRLPRKHLWGWGDVEY